MTIKSLRKLLDSIPAELDEHQVLASYTDHSYSTVDLSIQDVEKDLDGEYFEYFGKEYMNDGSINVKVLVIQ